MPEPVTCRSPDSVSVDKCPDFLFEEYDFCKSTHVTLTGQLEMNLFVGTIGTLFPHHCSRLINLYHNTLHCVNYCTVLNVL